MTQHEKRAILARRVTAGIRIFSLATLAFSTALVSQAAAPQKLAGSLIGSVRDSAGIPQMGAAVLLFNRYDKLLQRCLTDAKGNFGFDALLPDLYSVHVNLVSFVPALKRNISIQPGMQSVLAINLATLFSSIELMYSVPAAGTLMTDEWKWVLRSSMSSRPVLRIAPEVSDPRNNSTLAAFSDTRGIVRFTSGDSSATALSGSQPELGTAFALATSLYGSNQLQFTGNIGYSAHSALPAAGFRTSFSRADSAGPAVKLTMQQVTLPTRSGAVLGVASSTPALRTMSLTLIERAEITEDIHLDYGVSLDSVTFFDRLNYLSPFARLSYGLGSAGTIDLGYSSGAPPVDLLNSGKDSDSDLQQDLAALAMMPRMSLRGGRALVQRTQNFELGYRLEVGSRILSVGAFHERVGNGALTLASPAGLYGSGDLLPELSSNSSVFNIGHYTRRGYTASLTQALGERMNLTLAYGIGGVLLMDGTTLSTNDPDELRGRIRRAQRQWARMRVTGTAPVTGTRYSASYEWSDSTALTPGHVYLTQKIYPETGLNLRLRQPVPSFGIFAGRLEAIAELRNLLAQGYLPMTASGGRRLTLTQTPRAVRGGLSFIF